MPVAVKIVGIGTNKQLYSKSAINAPWSHVPGSSNLIGIAPLINKQIVGIRTNHRMYTKPSIGGSSPWREVPHSCCVKSAVQLSSGRVIGVGLGNQLWHRAGINGRWIHIPHSGAVTRITKTGNDAIIGIGMDRKLYIRSRYYSRWSGPLRNSGQVIDISMGSDGYLYGIGTDYSLRQKLMPAQPSGEGDDAGALVSQSHLGQEDDRELDAVSLDAFVISSQGVLAANISCAAEEDQNGLVATRTMSFYNVLVQ
eukprot:gene423-10093_t